MGERDASGIENHGSAAPAAAGEHAAQTKSRPRLDRLGVILVSIACLSISLPGLGAGLWDPPELEVAEYARRIAVNLLATSELTLEQAVNEVPTRRELGRGELPFTSIALGFKLLGLSEWAGRVPLMLWGILGVWATYALVLRLATPRAACWSALLLCFCPLYFVHARTLLGDIVTMASMAIACAGLGVFALDERLSRAGRVGWLGLGLFGMYVGFWCRGLLIGVAIPLLAISTTRLLSSGQSCKGGAKPWFLNGTLLAGATLSFALGAWALTQALRGADYSVLVGCSASHASSPPTHDAVLHQLGHALFPVSALLPFAVAGLVVQQAINGRRARLNVFVVSVLLWAVVVYTLVAPHAGVLPFGAVFACAISVGLMLSDISQMPLQNRAVGFGVSALFALLLWDFWTRPETVFAAYAVYDADFPAELGTFHRIVFGPAALALVGALLLGCFDAAKGRDGWRLAYPAYLRVLRSAFYGRLWMVLVFAIAASTLSACLVLLGSYLPALAALSPSWSLMRRVALNAWWMLLAAVLLVPLLVLLLRDGFAWLVGEGVRSAHGLSWHGATTRGAIGVACLCAISGALSLLYFPRLAALLSPKGVFTTYERLAAGRAPLGSLAHAGGAAAYYTSASTQYLATAEQAARWLLADGARRFLVLRASELAELNAQYRRVAGRRGNLPLVETDSSAVLLASNRSVGGSHNRFDDIILSTRPTLRHPVSANLGNRLEVLGWEIRDGAGVLVDHLLPGREYELSLAYEVIGRFEREWDTFVHIDGYGRRLNADHPTLQGSYPLELLWRGDIIVDRQHIVIEPNFTPGNYQLYFGLYRGKRRLTVERGAHDANRVLGGDVKIR